MFIEVGMLIFTKYFFNIFHHLKRIIKFLLVVLLVSNFTTIVMQTLYPTVFNINLHTVIIRY